MARRERPSRSAGTETKCELQMTPMIDVTFQLLIFFLCAVQFRTLEGKFSAFLPKEYGPIPTDSKKIEKVEIRLEVAETGTRRWELDPRVEYDRAEHGRRFVHVGRQLEYSVGPHKTRDLEQLREWLSRQVRLVKKERSEEPAPATIDARKGIVYEDVVRVLDLCKDVGFKEVVFSGSHEKD